MSILRYGDANARQVHINGDTVPIHMAVAGRLRPTFAFQKRLEFLSSGKLYLKKSVKAITLSYRTCEGSSRGLR